MCAPRRAPERTWTQLQLYAPLGAAQAPGAPSTLHAMLCSLAGVDGQLLRLRPTEGFELFVAESVALLLPTAASGSNNGAGCAVERGPQHLHVRAQLHAIHEMLKQFGPSFMRAASAVGE